VTADIIDDLDDPAYGGAQTVRVGRVALESVAVGSRVRVYDEDDTPEEEGVGVVVTSVENNGSMCVEYANGTTCCYSPHDWLAEVIAPPDRAPQHPTHRHDECPSRAPGRCGLCDDNVSDPRDAEIARLRAECNEWRMACEGLPAASPRTLRATLREAGEIIDGLRASARTDGATIGRLNAATVDLRTDRDTWRAVAEREETLAHQRNEIIAKLTADLAYHDRQAALHDATGKVAGHAEQCGCHGCTTGPLEREVARLRAALAKYGRHLVSCDLERCDGTGRPTRSVCTCGLADALTVQP
jgi:hypothetical protein